MMAKRLLLTIAVASLACSLWLAWQHARNAIARDEFLTLFAGAALVWFVLATIWAYWTPSRNG
jgi:hypothetical protein